MTVLLALFGGGVGAAFGLNVVNDQVLSVANGLPAISFTPLVPPSMVAV